MHRPLTSILIPSYNSSRWIGDAIRSAVNQTAENIEIIVSDDASTDETIEIARSFRDARIQIVAAESNRGLVGNHNHVLCLSRGTYLKFLHGDDELLPDCVETMVDLAMSDDGIGLVFAPRRIATDGVVDPEWIAEFGEPHRRFDQLAPINDGLRLAWQVLSSGFANWIGEPTSVLFSRRAATTVGIFNPRLKQIVDLELWLRIALRFRIGFVDRPLTIYRHHALSASSAHSTDGVDWLDPLWLAESLLVAEGGRDQRLQALRRRRLLQACKNQAGRIRHGAFDTELASYFLHRLRPRQQREANLHPRLSEPPVRI